MHFLIAVFTLILLTSYGTMCSNEVKIQLGLTTIYLGWKADYADQSVLFTVTQSRKRLEYIIIGFSDHGHQNGSDICIYQNGQLKDAFIDDTFQIQFDRSQDCQLVVNRRKMFQFRRRFSTCDPKDFAFETGTTQFIIAGGYEFTTNFQEEKVMKGTQYGLLLEPPISIEPLESDGVSFKILADGTLVPSNATTYWCIIRRIPGVVADRKHHIIKVKTNFHTISINFREIQMNALVKSGNEHIVHHMEPINYPYEAGLPLGGQTGKKYLKVEIHYNNLRLQAGIFDESGFVFFVTPNLRKYDAGIMEVGLIYSDANSIPPRQRDFPLTGHCIADCTKKLPNEGIYVFASQLHAHLSGRRIFTSHYREGVKIGEINRDDHYNTKWQHLAHIRPYVHILQGDTLSTTCVYETLSKNEVTLGGYGIKEEMCVNYLYYFPASEVEVCKSAVDNETLHTYFDNMLGIHERNLPTHLKFASVPWSARNVLSLKELYSTAPLNINCYGKDGALFPNHPRNWTAVPQPRVFVSPSKKHKDRMECAALND